MKTRKLTTQRIIDYTRHLQSEERAPATVEKYCRDIAAFNGWLAERTVTKERITRWKDHLLEQGLSPATVNSKISAVNG